MVKPQLQDCYDPIVEEDLAHFEEEIGARLPDAYRSFLQKHNGGYFPHVVSFQGNTVVDELYGLLPEGDKFEDLRATNRRLELRNGFVAIGSTDCGDQICIVVSGRDIGSIWWRCHESGWREPDKGDKWPPANHKRLADCFSVFLDGIIYDPEVDWDETIPVFLAAEQGDIETLSRNLSEQFELESRNERGQTLLICAAQHRQSQVVRVLIDRGANLQARDNWNRTALNWAAASSSMDSIKLLIAAGADLEAADDEGNTPLLQAVPIAERAALYLIEHGANVNAINQCGYSPLQYCTGFGTDRLRKALIRAGADESLARTPVPRTPLQTIHKRRYGKPRR